MRILEAMMEAILLDMDGTLIDSNAQHAKAWQQAFAKFDVHIGFETLLRQIGKGGDQLLPVFLEKAQVSSVGPAIEKVRKEIFQREYRDTLQPFPKVRQLVERMKKAGLKIAIASSAGKDELQYYKKLARVDDLIEEETTSEDAEKSKPHPDIFGAALERLGVQASHALSLGDTPYDAEASGKIGIRTIGLTCGGWPKQDLQAAGCIEIYADPAELLAHFDKSALGPR